MQNPIFYNFTVGGDYMAIEDITGQSVDMSINHSPEAVAMHKVNTPEIRDDHIIIFPPYESNRGFHFPNSKQSKRLSFSKLSIRAVELWLK